MRAGTLAPELSLSHTSQQSCPLPHPDVPSSSHAWPMLPRTYRFVRVFCLFVCLSVSQRLVWFPDVTLPDPEGTWLAQPGKQLLWDYLFCG